VNNNRHKPQEDWMDQHHLLEWVEEQEEEEVEDKFQFLIQCREEEESDYLLCFILNNTYPK